jgi:hypothetical protein
MTPLETSALLGIIEQAGLAVVTLVEGLEQDELLRSRLTRTEVLRQLNTLAGAVAQLSPEVCADMPELDWAGWGALAPRLSGPPGQALDEALWFACESLAPATLLWLRVYRQGQPERFRMTA